MNRRWQYGTSVAAAIAASLSLTLPAHLARAQIGPNPNTNPAIGAVYLDDSPAAIEGLARAAELSGVGNNDEAARVLQRLLDEHAEQVAPAGPTSPGAAADPDLYVPVRSRINDLLKSRPALLESYRRTETAAARALLQTGQYDACRRTRLLTQPGYEASLRIAQRQLEDARFQGCVFTLLELDDHPDRKADTTGRAAELLDQAVRYARSGLRPFELAKALDARIRWAKDAGKPAPPTDLASMPTPDLTTGKSTLDALGATTLTTVPSRALASDFLGRPIENVRNLTGRPDRRTPDDQILLYATPCVSGDSVYVNDSETITAWDRFTLTRRWRVQIDAPPTLTTGFNNNTPALEDAVSLAAWGDRVATASGLGLTGRSSQDRAVTVLDARNGRVIWSQTLSELGDPALGECVVRGPVLIDQEQVIVAAHRQSVEKRLLGAVLASFDLETGDLRWQRNLGSVGALPWSLPAWSAEATLADGGVLYRADRIGTISAVESASGRVLWMRRVTLGPVNLGGGDMRRSDRVMPWQTQRPVLLDGQLFTLSPDGSWLTSIDAVTGAMLSRINTQRLATPLYLLGVPSTPGAPARLVTVSDTLVSVIDLSVMLENAPVRKIPLPAPIRGRVVLVGDELAVPNADGVAFVPLKPTTTPPTEAAAADKAAPGTPENPAIPAPESDGIRMVHLDHPGNVLPLESEFLVVDDTKVYSYLVWDLADDMLQKRMDADPNNPVPAVTYAQLAYQAGRHEKLLAAVERAARAIESDPLATANDASRRRLLNAILDMVDPPAENVTLARLSDDARRTLVDRSLRLAGSPAEQVSALMSAGRFDESASRPREAVEHYQEILLSPELSSQNYTRDSTTTPADTEAARRLRRIVHENGRDVYATYELEARQKLEEAMTNRDETALERLARAYPVSTAAPRAWMELAARLRSRGRESQAISALEEGFAAAADSLEPSDPLLGQLIARMVTTTADSGRVRAGMRFLDNAEKRYGKLGLTLDNKPLDWAELRRSLQQRASGGDVRARYGQPAPLARLIAGYTPLTPSMGRTPGQPNDRVVMGAASGEISLWKVGQGASGPDLTRLWSDPVGVQLLRIDSRGVLLSRAQQDNGRFDQSVLRRDLDSGKLLWEIKSFRELFAGETVQRTAPGADERMDTPTRAGIPLNELTALADERTLVLVERTGRAAGFDIDSGRLLWAASLPVERVYDATMVEGAGVLIGPAPADADPKAAGPNAAHDDDSTPCIIVAFEARSGQVLTKLKEAQELRWARATPEAGVLIGGLNGLVMFDPGRLTLRWRNEASTLRETMNAWPVDGRALVRDGGGSTLLQIDTDTGMLLDHSLDTRSKSDQQGLNDATVEDLGSAELMLTSHGLLLFDRAGKLLGADTLSSDSSILAAAPGAQCAVVIDRSEAAGGPDERGVHRYAIHTFELTGLRQIGELQVELPAPPSAIAALDGVVLVGSNANTLVLPAPAK